MDSLSDCVQTIRACVRHDKQIPRLKPHQVEPARKMLDIISRWGFVFNTSGLGAGKSFMCLDVINRLDVKKAVIVCPASVTTAWEKIKETYISKEFDIVTYDKFRGTGRSEGDFVIVTSSGGFAPSNKLKAYTKLGVVFVFDECHRLKGETLNNKATSFVLDYAREHSPLKTKVIFLSGTLMDKEECALNFFKLIGMRGNLIKEKCGSIDPSIYTDEIKGNFALFKRVIIGNMSVCCSCEKKSANSFSQFFDLRESVEDFEEIMARLEEYITKKFDVATRASFIRDCMALEYLKTGIFIEQAKQCLDEGCKVVLVFNFKESLEKCVDALLDFNPLVFQGSTPIEKRKRYLKLFQQDNSKHSLIIGNIQVLSEGIDLDDKTGIYKRKVFASPNYSIIKTDQLINRFSRLDTISEADVCWIYATQGRREENIIEALRQKSIVMNSLFVT